MAPWPEQGNEPKAPDRNKSGDNRTLDNLKSKSEPPEDKKLIKGISKEDQSEAKKKDVYSLDDGQLKALLDEAIQYKNPKDREGKSKIFRELLQKVEADESDCSYPVLGIRGSGGRRALRVREGSKSIGVSERASRGGSLQNIFHAASSAEFDTHHSGGARRKNKRQGPGSSVSARQREGGSLPSNVNTGWPLESWQSDQIKKKGFFDRDSQQQNHVSASFGNTAYCNSSSVATTSTQARRQTLKHSASNELPSSRKQSPGELYPLRRHHSSSDQLRSFELSIVKLKSQSESSSMVRKMPQLSKPSDCVSLDMGSLNLEMKKLSDSDPSLSFEKKLQNLQNSERYRCVGGSVFGGGEVPSAEAGGTREEGRSHSGVSFRITSCEAESENPSNNSQEVFTSRASLEVEPVDSSIELDFGEKRVNLERVLEKRVWNGMESVQLSDNYPSVQCIVGDGTRISDASNQGRMSEQLSGIRPHMYRNFNMNMNMISLVNISSKTANDSPRTDENGNALNVPSLTSRGPNSKKISKKKLLAEKNVVFSQNIAGYRGYSDIDEILNFIESDKTKNKQLKKSLAKGKKHEKKRQNMQKSSSLEEVSQRNIEDLTEGSESEKTSVRKPRVSSNADTGLRERRRWGEQGFVKSGSQNDLSIEQGEENNSDSEFQMVTKKQRKRKVNEPNPKRGRNHRNSRRSPRRKSTSSVPPSERSGDSDLDSVHSLPVGGAPAVSYADIAAGNTCFFSSKGINDMSTLNGNSPEKLEESGSAVKTNEIEEWCNSISQHLEKANVNINNNNNNNHNNNHININNRSNGGVGVVGNNNSGNNNNNSNKNNSINSNNNNIHNNNNININHTNNNNVTSDIKNCSRHENRKQNLDVNVNEICDNNNVKKLKDLVTVDGEAGTGTASAAAATANAKAGEVPLRNELKKITSNCDLDQCKVVDNKNNNSSDAKKNWNKKNLSREDFPSLPVKSEAGIHYQRGREVSEQNAFAKTKQYSSLPDSEKHGEEGKAAAVAAAESSVGKGPKKPRSEEEEEEGEARHRRATRSRSVGPNARPPVILLHDERTKDNSVCEITFGFEVNEQLLTSDQDPNQALEEEAEAMDETSSSSSKSSGRGCDNPAADANGGIVYNDVLENRNAYIESGKPVIGEITNSTLQELFKRHESMAGPKGVPADANSSPNAPANSIANKYVPPVAPVQFNHDKIVTFVGMAWEDVMRNGKIQYYTGDN